MIGHRLNGCRHQHRQGRAVERNGGKRRIRREARMDCHGCTKMQGRRGLDVEATDVKEGQHGEDMITGGEVVHVLAHHGVPQQRFLSQHRALGPSGCTRGVDDQQRTGEIGMRIAAVAARAPQQRVERASMERRKIEAHDACVGHAFFQHRQNIRKGLFEHQHLYRGIGQNEQLLGHGKPPVQRHQHGAESRAGIEQHQIVRPIQAEDRDAIATADAEFRLKRPRGLLDACTERRVTENFAFKNSCRPVRRECRVAFDEIRQVHAN